MKKNVAIGVAAAAAVSGIAAYFVKRRSAKKVEATPEAARTRHRTDVFSKAKPHHTHMD